MKLKCNKCNSEKLFIEIQGDRRGLYCGECGKWQKWITKEELQVAKFNEIKILNKNNKQIDKTTSKELLKLKLDIYQTILAYSWNHDSSYIVDKIKEIQAQLKIV